MLSRWRTRPRAKQMGSASPMRCQRPRAGNPRSQGRPRPKSRPGPPARKGGPVNQRRGRRPRRRAPRGILGRRPTLGGVQRTAMKTGPVASSGSPVVPPSGGLSMGPVGNAGDGQAQRTPAQPQAGPTLQPHPAEPLSRVACHLAANKVEVSPLEVGGGAPTIGSACEQGMNDQARLIGGPVDPVGPMDQGAKSLGGVLSMEVMVSPPTEAKCQLRGVTEENVEAPVEKACRMVQENVIEVGENGQGDQFSILAPQSSISFEVEGPRDDGGVQGLGVQSEREWDQREVPAGAMTVEALRLPAALADCPPIVFGEVQSEPLENLDFSTMALKVECMMQSGQGDTSRVESHFSELGIIFGSQHGSPMGEPGPAWTGLASCGPAASQPCDDPAALPFLSSCPPTCDSGMDPPEVVERPEGYGGRTDDGAGSPPFQAEMQAHAASERGLGSPVVFSMVRAEEVDFWSAWSQGNSLGPPPRPSIFDDGAVNILEPPETLRETPVEERSIRPVLAIAGSAGDMDVGEGSLVPVAPPTKFG